MFDVVLLQSMCGLSDERYDYQIKDRLSRMRFLGVGLAGVVPDANTIWTFQEALKRANAVQTLLARFDTSQKAAGYLAMGGRSGAMIAVPKQRNSEAEWADIRARFPKAWRTNPLGCATRTAMCPGG